MDEAVEGSVQDSLRIAHLVAGSQILHLLVRVEHIRADLTPEADVLRGTTLAGELRLAFLLLQLGEPRLEDP